MGGIQLDEESIFDVAIQLECSQGRASYLQQVCGNDLALMERVKSLLEIHYNDQSFLANPPVDMPATLEARTVKERPGDSIGPYKLLQKIGEGGFGVVYMAQQTRPVRRKVALKIIKPGMDTHEVIARFEAERQALAMMDHPNIAKVFDGGETESGRPYFVMELVKGISITQFCDEQRLPTDSRLRLFSTVCSAIQHAHQKGVIHRDIKPANVMVTLHDGQPVPKVIDFGVSKAINQQLTEKTLFTNYGQMVGTPQYMSPEQAEMSGLDVDTRSDIYSLGVLLYELLTGTTPLEAERLRNAGFAEMQRLIKEQDPPKPSTRVSGATDRVTASAMLRGISAQALQRSLRGELDWVVMMALEKDRSRRYETAKGLANDLERYLCNEAVSACPPSRTYALRKAIRRNRVLVFATSAVIVALAIGWFATLSQKRETVLALQDKETARVEAVIARGDAEAARAREAAESSNRQHLIELQSLQLAYEALNSGNTQNARKYLKRVKPIDGSPESIPYRFLSARIRELDPVRIEFSSRIACWMADPLDDFHAVVLESGDIVLVDPQASSPPPPVYTYADDRVFRAIEISPDGQTLLLASSLKETKEHVIEGFRIHRDRERPYVERTDLRVSHGTRIRTVKCVGPTNGVVSVDADGEAQLWDNSTGQIQETLAIGADDSNGISCSTDGKVIVSWRDRQARFYDQHGKSHSFPTPEIGGRITDIAFADESVFATMSYAGLQLWKLTPMGPIAIRTLGKQRGSVVSFSHDRSLVAGYSNDEQAIHVYETTSGDLRTRVPVDIPYDFGAGTQHILVGNQSVTCASGNSLSVYQIPQEGTDFRSTTASWYANFAVAQHKSTVAFPSSEGTIAIWNVVSGRTSYIGDRLRNQRIKGIAIDSLGDRLTVQMARNPSGGRSPGLIGLWNLQSEQLTRRDPTDVERIWCMQFSPVDRNLVVRSGDRTTACLRNLVSGRSQPLTNSLSDGKILSCEFSPETGHLLVVSGNVWTHADATRTPATLWRINDRQIAEKVTEIPVYNTYRAVFSNDEKLIAFISGQATEIQLWDIDRNDFLEPVPVSSGRVISIDFSPNDECLVATSPSGEIKFIDYRAGEELCTFRVQHPLRHVRFLDAADRLIVSSMDDLIFQWAY